MRLLRLVLLEDSAADAELVELALHGAGFLVESTRATTRDEFVRALAEFAPNIVVSDHSLAEFNAVSALRTLQATRPGVPLIVVSGALDESVAVACLRAGAESIVLKHRLHRLAPAVEAAIEARRDLATLSPRQIQVLCLVARGNTTRQIAEQFRISDKTVETHRGEIMKRTGIHDLASLTRYAIRLGLVSAAE
jgi:DNA-binding NarL/FixJ family response regulator